MLPREIVAEILSWLPVKLLLRFRCVSKPWCSLIDSNDFIKLHLNRSAKTSSNRSIILDGTDDRFCLSLDSLKRVDVGVFPTEDHIILNSCNGLVLLASRKPLLWNPSTRKVKILPFTPIESEIGKEVYVSEVYGFGYDSKKDDYKVVRVAEIYDPDERYLFSETKIYSLKSNSWTRVRDFPYILPAKRVWGAHVNDALHLVIESCPHYGSTQFIIAFHVGTAEISEIPQMDLNGENIGINSVEAMGGCLTALVPRKMNTSDIWVMKEYGVKESWTKLLSFVPPVPEVYMGLCPLAYSSSGDKVLLNYDDGRCLIWFDLKRQKPSKVISIPSSRQCGCAFESFGLSFHAEFCVGSLMSVDSPGDAEKRKGKEKKGNKIKKSPRVAEKQKGQEERGNEIKKSSGVAEKQRGQEKKGNGSKKSLVSLDSPGVAEKQKGQEKMGSKTNKRDDFLSVGFKLKLDSPGVAEKQKGQVKKGNEIKKSSGIAEKQEGQEKKGNESKKSLVSLDSAGVVEKQKGREKMGNKTKKRDDFLSIGFKLKL